MSMDAVRTLVPLISIIILGCRSDPEQQDAITTARSLGASVRINVEGDATWVNLRHCRMDRELKDTLAGMSEIQSLVVGKTFTDVDVDILEGRTNLKSLDLSYSGATYATFAALPSLTQMSFLGLNGLQLTEEDVSVISTLRQLTSLSLIDADISEEGLQAIEEANPMCLIVQ
jgi:hypothetical protein